MTPPGEGTGPRAGVGDHLQDLLIRGVEVGVSALPEALVDGVGAALGWVAGSVLRIRRRVVEANLRQAFPARDDRWIRRQAAAFYRHLGREGVSLLRMRRMHPQAILERTLVEGLEVVADPVSQGRGVVLLTGHLGNWEAGGAAVAVRGLPLDAVVRPQNNPLFDARINRTREALGIRVVPRGGSTRTLLRSLRQGRVVALAADQNVLTGGVFVDFFGRPAATARGPAILSERTGAAMVFATALRLPGTPARYRVHFEALESPAPRGAGPGGNTPGEGPGVDPDAGTRELLRRYLAALEEAIARAPEQYLWAHKRWKTRPPPAEGGEEQGPAGTVPP